MKFKIYSKQGCSSCTQAKQLLESKGIEFEYLMFGRDHDMEKFLSLNSRHKSFPLITIVERYDGVDMHEQYIGGLAELKEVLATK